MVVPYYLKEAIAKALREQNVSASDVSSVDINVVLKAFTDIEISFNVLKETAKTDIFTDPRDGREYRTVKIGGQVWMAENLDYDAACEQCRCYNNDSYFRKKYGLLYSLEAAKKAAPDGWHLPTDKEWDELMDFAGENAGTKLKSAGGWNDYSGASGCGTDDYGFSALPGGFRLTDGSFPLVGGSGYWWSATESGSSSAYTRSMYFSSENVYRLSNAKANLFSVRCLQD